MARMAELAIARMLWLARAGTESMIKENSGQTETGSQN